MKTYLRGLITGGVFGFAMLMLMGSGDISNHGRWTYHSDEDGQVFFDTVEGIAYTRSFVDLDGDGFYEVSFGFLDAKKIKAKAEERDGLTGY